MAIIDIIIPTLNCDSKLELCLQSISQQDFNNYIVYVIDGGSNDKTLQVAKNYNCKIFSNPLKTAEAGKAVGIKHSKSPFLAFIDSDNILPTTDWLKIMLAPFKISSQLVGSEPWAYTYRPQAGFIERYSSLTGVNDPYILVNGNFDRINYLYPSWTNLNIPIKNYQNFQIAKINPKKVFPTIGANGTIFKRKVFDNFQDDFFFDIDVLFKLKNPVYFAKVKIGIIHSYCESSIAKFIKKQIRRATDLYIFKSMRSNPLITNHTQANLKFLFYTLSLIFPLFHTLKGFIKKPDIAWFFHPLACFITLYAYSSITIKNTLGILHPINRRFWSQ